MSWRAEWPRLRARAARGFRNANNWRLLRPLLRDGLLVIALTIALTTLDGRGRIGTLWACLPLGIAALLFTLAGHYGRPWSWRHVGALVAIGGGLGLRAVASLTGPLPAAGLREAIDLAVILTLGVSLWSLALADVRRAAGVWIVALGIGWLAEAYVAIAGGEVVAGRAFDSGESPAARTTMGISVLFGLALLDSWRRGEVQTQPPLRPRWRVALRLACFSIGGLAGLWLARQPGGLSGARALGDLWLQSVLIGWGRHAAEPLARVLALPHPVEFQAWGGIWGLLAMGGVLGVGVLTVVLLFVVSGPAPRSDVRGVTLIALFIGGLMLLGGPLTSVPLLVLAGWLALAWGATPSKRRRREDAAGDLWGPRSIGATGTGALLLGLATLLLALPVRGDMLLRKSMEDALSPNERQRLLGRAQGYNPFNPAIPIKLAAVLREQMSRTPQWSESLYRATIAAYERAERLEPHESLHALAKADFQLRCKRNDEALAGVRNAMDRMPHAVELADWLYVASVRLGQTQQAYRALDLGLREAPASPNWWLRQFELSHANGQRMLAAQSISVALTADPADAEVGATAWDLSRGGDGGTGAAVELPAKGGR